MRRALTLLFAAGLLCAQPPKPPDAAPAKPVGTIHGVVKDADTGEPLPGFRVGTSEAVGDIRYTRSSNTDGEGRYTLGGLSPGSLLVNAFDSQHQQVEQRVQLSAGQDLTLNFLIPGSPVLSGRVLDQDKQPVVDAFVWVIQAQYSYGFLRHSLIGPKITGEDGEFTFDAGLEPDRAYYVVADQPPPDDVVTREPLPLDQRERIQTTTYCGDATSFEAAAPLVLRPGEHREQVDIHIRKAVSYCADGKVEASGKPASVLFALQELPLAGTSLTRLKAGSAEDGTFRVCGLTPGAYRLAASDSERLPGAVEFAIANSDIHHVHLALDTVPLHLELAWDGDPPSEPEPLPAMARGFAPSEDGTPNPVPLSPEQLRKMFGVVLADEIAVNLIHVMRGGLPRKVERVPYDGPFGADIPTGDYAIQLHMAPGAYAKEISYGGVSLAGGLLRLAAGTSGTLRIVGTLGGASLSAKVTDADGNSVADSTVVLIPAGATTAPLLSWLMQTSRTDQNGTWKSGILPPGKYRVLAVTRPVRPIPEEIDKLWLALSHAKEVELGPKDTAQVDLHPEPIQ